MEVQGLNQGNKFTNSLTLATSNNQVKTAMTVHINIATLYYCIIICIVEVCNCFVLTNI